MPPKRMARTCLSLDPQTRKLDAWKIALSAAVPSAEVSDGFLTKRGSVSSPSTSAGCLARLARHCAAKAERACFFGAYRLNLGLPALTQGGLVCFYSRAWPTRSAAHRRGGVPPTGGRGGREEFFLEGERAGWLGSRATQSLGCPSMMSSLTVLAPPTSPSPLVSHAMNGSWSLDSHSTQTPHDSPSRKRNFLPSFVCHLSESVLPLAPAPRPRGWVDHASLPTPAVTSRA